MRKKKSRRKLKKKKLKTFHLKTKKLAYLIKEKMILSISIMTTKIYLNLLKKQYNL
jgi:hypothetical protein